ncbi:hypothetical protein [Actinoplanes sp. OR16]|uniref:hypothetical protein n=1 Tax=Actinoplanes sp. OR16 TaxID=946334 RepID=UPI000FD6E93E|nr:hypothetical protein [Actinoplanes sp. OR16]
MSCTRCGSAVQNTGHCGVCGQQAYGPPQHGLATPPPYMVVPQPGYVVAGTGRAFSVAAFVFSAVALFIVPILFGAVAAILAGVAKKRGEQWAGVALRVAVAAAGFGMVVGAIVRMSA